VWIDSDDPDEWPLPIRILGATPQLDPGEAALPFALPEWPWHPPTQAFLQGTFDLEHVDGQVAFSQDLGTW
jgi:hypothetical protein